MKGNKVGVFGIEAAVSFMWEYIIFQSVSTAMEMCNTKRFPGFRMRFCYRGPDKRVLVRMPMTSFWAKHWIQHSNSIYLKMGNRSDTAARCKLKRWKVLSADTYSTDQCLYAEALSNNSFHRSGIIGVCVMLHYYCK